MPLQGWQNPCANPFNSEAGPRLDFEGVAEKAGVRFSATVSGRLFRRECKAIFARERQERNRKYFF
jgi:hypothetical protein